MKQKPVKIQTFQTKSLVTMILIITIAISCKKNLTSEIAHEKGKVEQKFHTFNINGNKVIIKEENGQYFAAEDITLSKKQFQILKGQDNNKTVAKERGLVTNNLTTRWPGGIVYYTLNFGADSQYAISAMNQIAAGSSGLITFVARTNQSNYVTFFKNDALNISSLGMIGGQQFINIADSKEIGVIMHETMHALGFAHEQNRPDRDQYVEINYANMLPNVDINFNIFSDFIPIGQLDFSSIMMYGSYAFSANGEPTMTKISGTVFQEQRTYLSDGDKAALVQAYF
jgi:hypothetical protein